MMENVTSAIMGRVQIVGGGPAGLMAAETIANAGIGVDLYDAMPSVGRKFLLAGKSGLNLTHAEPSVAFLERYGPDRAELQAMIADFDAQALRDWAQGLGIETFVGSSGRVFPTEMKAAPLLRSWLRRLRAQGVQIHVRHKWLSWNEQGLVFDTPEGQKIVSAQTCVMALGGASWPRLGSDGKWSVLFQKDNISCIPWQPANCGFDVCWSPIFREKFAGQPLSNVFASVLDENGQIQRKQGQFVITEQGVEGSLIYALSAILRKSIQRQAYAILEVDLIPDKSCERILSELERGRGARSLSSHLQSRLGLDKCKINLLREVLGAEQMNQSAVLARAIKALPLRLEAARPVDEAISSAGGVAFSAVDEFLMLRQRPGYFCAGEMLDWEAPTGGYLLTACFATGRRAGLGVLNWLSRTGSSCT